MPTEIAWVQLYIKTERTPEQLQRVEPLLMRFTAAFVAPDGLPIQTKDGMYEIRVFEPALSLRFVERLLDDQGLTIAARDEHAQEER